MLFDFQESEKHGQHVLFCIRRRKYGSLTSSHWKPSNRWQEQGNTNSMSKWSCSQSAFWRVPKRNLCHTSNILMTLAHLPKKHRTERSASSPTSTSKVSNELPGAARAASRSNLAMASLWGRGSHKLTPTVSHDHKPPGWQTWHNTNRRSWAFSHFKKALPKTTTPSSANVLFRSRGNLVQVTDLSPAESLQSWHLNG